MGKVTARFALQGQPCAKPYRVRALPALGYRAFQVLKYVETTVAESGVSPSYNMICEHVGIATRGEVSRIVSAIERRGLCERIADGPQPRIRLPGQPAPPPIPEKPKPVDPRDGLIPHKEAAKLLGLSVCALHNARKRDIGPPAQKIGFMYFYNPDDFGEDVGSDLRRYLRRRATYWMYRMGRPGWAK